MIRPLVLNVIAFLLTGIVLRNGWLTGEQITIVLYLCGGIVVLGCLIVIWRFIPYLIADYRKDT